MINKRHRVVSLTHIVYFCYGCAGWNLLLAAWLKAITPQTFIVLACNLFLLFVFSFCFSERICRCPSTRGNS